MATSSKGVDRRAQRTRQVLRQAFLDIAQEKGLMTASVQEIAERANVSRGAFYAHYADKYALIETIVRDNFRHMVGTPPLPAESRSRTFHLLIQRVLDYFKKGYQRHHVSPDIALLTEKALHEELHKLIIIWLQQSQSNEAHIDVPIERLAQIISWAIFGAAVQWSQEVTTISSEKRAYEIACAIQKVAHLTADEVPG